MCSYSFGTEQHEYMKDIRTYPICYIEKYLTNVCLLNSDLLNIIYICNTESNRTRNIFK